VSSTVQDERVAEEAWLIARTGAGDREAFRELYRRYGAPIYSLGLRMLGDRRDAEELLQDTFLKIWNHARSYDASLARPFTWAVMIARRAGIDALRRKGRYPELSFKDLGATDREEMAPSPVEATMRDDESARVRAAMAAFPPDQRAAVELAIFGGLSHGAIAQRLRQPLGTVKSWIRRGLDDLKTSLSGE